jgi:hypothetical protein
MSNELISKIILTYSFSFWLLVLFSVVFLNCGDNIKVYFSIVTHEIPLRVRTTTRRTHFSMMFNIHKHISHLIFVLVPEFGEYEICNQKIIFYWPFSSVIDRNRNRPFNLIQNNVGYRSCFATGVKLEQFLWNSFDKHYFGWD